MLCSLGMPGLLPSQIRVAAGTCPADLPSWKEGTTVNNHTPATHTAASAIGSLRGYRMQETVQCLVGYHFCWGGTSGWCSSLLICKEPWTHVSIHSVNSLVPHTACGCNHFFGSSMMLYCSEHSCMHLCPGKAMLQLTIKISIIKSTIIEQRIWK